LTEKQALGIGRAVAVARGPAERSRRATDRGGGRAL